MDVIFTTTIRISRRIDARKMMVDRLVVDIINWIDGRVEAGHSAKGNRGDKVTSPVAVNIEEMNKRVDSIPKYWLG